MNGTGGDDLLGLSLSETSRLAVIGRDLRALYADLPEPSRELAALLERFPGPADTGEARASP